MANPLNIYPKKLLPEAVMPSILTVSQKGISDYVVGRLELGFGKGLIKSHFKIFEQWI